MNKLTIWKILGASFLSIGAISVCGAVLNNSSNIEENKAATSTSTYYSSVNGTGSTLLSSLCSTISSNVSYVGYDGLKSAYSSTDVRSDGYLYDLYSDNTKYTPGSSFASSYSSVGDGYNREHTIPQSWWSSGTTKQGCDLFIVLPSDAKANGMRSNYPYGETTSGTAYKLSADPSGNRLGTSTSTSYVTGTVFEPFDSRKGDLARTYFYAATMYLNSGAGSGAVTTWTSGYGSSVFSSSGKNGFVQSYLNMLLAWHKADPVSSWEISRNDAVENKQGNRNPFIDHPSWVDLIWGGTYGSSNTNGESISSSTTVVNGVTTTSGSSSSTGITSISKTSMSLSVGGTSTISATSSNSGTITWSTSNSSVASISSTSASSGSSITVTGVAAGSATLTAKVTISGTSYTKTCAVTVSSSGSSSSSTEGTYELVTSTSDLSSGDTLVIGNATNSVVAGALSSGYLSSTSATFSNTTITSLGDGLEFTLGGSSGAWTLTASAGQLYSSAAKSVNFSSSGTGTWTISISSGTATITNGTSSYGSIQYNSSNPRFTTYTSSQTSVELYKKVVSSSSSGGSSASGDYSIVFATASSDGSTEATTSTLIGSTYTSTNTLVNSVSSVSKCYAGKSGLKLGASSSTGSFTAVPVSAAQSNVASITITSTQYSSDTGTLTLSVNGSSVKTGITVGTDYTYTPSSAISVTSFGIATSSKRAYVGSVAFTLSSSSSTTKTLSSISTSGQTTSYYVGDTFSYDGTCTATFSDGTTSTVTPTVTSTPSMSSSGTKTVTLSYTYGSTTKTVSYSITVTAVTLSSISISGYTTSFVVGDTFSFGGTVTATYNNGSTSDVTSSASFSGYNMSTAGTYTVTVSYTSSGTTKTATYSITVSNPTVTSISVSGMTTSYTVGDTFSFDGTCTASYSNNTSKTVTPTSVSSPSMSTTGTKTITVKYTENSVTVSTTYSITVTAAAATVTSVTVSPSTLSLDLNGTTSSTLTATVSGTNSPATTVTWSSSNTSVATVSSAGTVTAKGTGTATITATSTADSSKSGTCTVTVSDTTPTVTSVTLSSSTLSLDLNGTKTSTLTAAVTGTNSPSATVTWSTSDSSVATVSSGTVTAVATGSATITATSTVDTTKYATCTVTVTDSSSSSSGGETSTSTYTIVFATASSDGNTALTTSTFLTTSVYSSNTLVSSISSTSYCYAGKSGLKIGRRTGSSVGTFTAVPVSGAQSNVKSISVATSAYSTDSTTLTLSVNGSTATTGTAGNTITYTPSSTIDVSTFAISTSSSKRAYISSITFTIETTSSGSESGGGSGSTDISGSYTFSSNTTTYNASPTFADVTNGFDSNVFTVASQSNVRVGGSGSGSSGTAGGTSDYMFYATSSADASLTITLNDTNYIVSKVSITACVNSSSESPTMSCGNLSKTVTDLSPKGTYNYYPLNSQFTIDVSTARVFISEITVTVIPLSDEHLGWGQAFLEMTADECSAGTGISSSTWADCATVFNNVSSSGQSTILDYTSDVNGDACAEALARYENIIANYNLDDFLARGNSANKMNLFKDNSTNNLLVIFGALSMLTGLTFMMYYFKKKKQEE